MDRFRVRDGVLSRLAILDQRAAEDAVDRIYEPDAGAEFVHLIVGIVAEAVGPDDDVAGIFHEQIALMPAVDVVAGDGDVAGAAEMDVDALAADKIAGDGPHADLVVLVGAGADEADVAAVGAVGGLDGVADDRPFADRSCSDVDVDFGGRNVVPAGNLVTAVVVVLDVAARHLKVADFASASSECRLGSKARTLAAQSCRQ